MASTDVVQHTPTPLAVHAPNGPGEVIEVWRGYYEIAEAIKNTDFVPKGMRNNPAAIAAAMLTGRELGLPEMASLSLIYVYEGRPGLYAEGMRALVLGHGHEIWIDENEFTGNKVTLCGRRAGAGNVSKVTWTQEMVVTAGLDKKENHRKYPRSMKLARATGDLCRLLFADVIRGVPYTIEEIEDGFIEGEEVAGELGSGEDAPKTHTRKAAPAKKSAAKRAVPPAAVGPPPAPPEPPLPGEEDPTASTSVASSESEEQEGPDPDVMERSKSIAIACQRAGLDDEGRHRLIGVVTNGRVESAKTVTAEEGALVLQAAHDIVNGRLSLIEGDEGWCLVEVEDASGDQADEDAEQEPEAEGTVPSGDAAGWSGDEWRSFLKARGLSVTATIKMAQQLAGEFDEKPAPASLDQLRGKQKVCEVLRNWAEAESVGS